MPIMCEIVSQDRIVYQGEVDIVLIPGVEGELGILPNHSPLLTIVNYGVISTRMGKEEEYFTVAGGIAEVQHNKVTILADSAENVAEIDISRAEEARKRAEHLLHEEIDSIGDDYLKIHSMLRRSMLRINAVKRYRNRLKIRILTDRKNKMPGFTREFGIDLGTMNTVIAEGNQILLQEPTVVALNCGGTKTCRVGTGG